MPKFAICVLALALSTTLAFSADVSGVGKTQRSTYVLDDGYLNRRACGQSHEYQISVLGHEKSRILYKDESFDVLTSYRRTSYKGVPVEQYSMPDYPWVSGSRTKLDLYVPIDPRVRLVIGNFTACPDAGWAPNHLLILIEPRSRGRLDAWAADNNAKILRQRPGMAINEYWINVPTGYEDRLSSELLSKPWVLDVVRDAFGAGPENVFLRFELGALLTKSTRQMYLRDRIFEALSSRYGEMISRESMLAKRGYSYELKISGRARDLLRNSEYRNRWLDATVRIDVTTTGTIDGPEADRIILEIAHGNLPTWSDQREGPPPPAHTQEFSLQEGSKDKFKNFSSLIALQSGLADAIASGLDGEVEFDPYAYRQ